MRNARPLAAAAIVAVLLSGTFRLAGAQDHEDLYRMLEPDPVGIARFVERIEAVRSAGREPLGLVLSGGLARSFAHIGLLAVLEERGIRPDFIVGDSLGAVIGILYAAGFSPDSLSALAHELADKELFDVVLPTAGGFLHAGRFASLLAYLTGNPDIAELPIPLLVIADDLMTGRQVRLASGRLDRVAIASIALPAVFEPVPLDGRLLVDGGSTDLIPFIVAREYSSNVLVSATLHGEKGALSGILGIIMRTFDTSLVGRAMRALDNMRPPVVWNDVESIPNLAFADAADIVALGERSARDSSLLDRFAAGVERGFGRAGSELDTARAGLEAVLPGSFGAVERGLRPRGGEDIRIRVSFNIADPWREGLLPEAGRRYARLELARAGGWAASSLGVLAGFSDAGRRIAAVSGSLSLNPYDALVADAAVRMWLPLDSAIGGGVEAGAGLSWRIGRPGLSFTPSARVSGAARAPLEAVVWEARFGGTLSVSARGDPGSRASRVDVSGGWFFRAPGASGPEMQVQAFVRPLATARLGFWTTGRADLLGSGAVLPDAGLLRGVRAPPPAASVIAGGLDFAWNDMAFAPGLGEAFVLRDLALGPYLDIAWNPDVRGSGGFQGSAVAGVCLSLTASLMGLVPLDLAAFAGMEMDGAPVLGLRAGRHFPP